MREIKFRGIEIDTADFVYGYLTYSEQEEMHYIGTSELMKPVLSGAIGMFTGIYDKHGKPIYEDDIVKAWDYSLDADWNKTDVLIGPITGVVDWSDDLLGFNLSSKDDSPINPLVHQDVFEVIGNIYENPELL